MSTKINLQINNQKFQLPSTSLKTKGWGDKSPYIYMNAKNTASILKQYVKLNFPSIKVWAGSDTYSGGSSVRINLSNSDGSSVTETVYNQIRSFSQNFKAGSFNGMIDMYENREDDFRTDNGTVMDYFPSYIFVENRAKWDSVEYWINEIINEGRVLEQQFTYMSKGVKEKVILALSTYSV